VLPLLEDVHSALTDFLPPWELILVDDGSSDGTADEALRHAPDFGSHVQVVTLQRNYGQTAAMQAGVDLARGEYIATMDGDLQNDPADIPRLVDRIHDEDLDLIVGWRKDRKDNLLARKIPSRIANRLIGRATGVQVHDYGCSLKVYRTSVIKRVRLYGEMHRFIPAWMAIETSPSRIKEEVVNHRARIHGTSKYGISRVFRVILDLLSVFFFQRFLVRPGHFFGVIGLAMGTIGILTLSYLVVLKFGLGEDIGGRPLFVVGILFVLMSLQFLMTGILSELMARTYFSSPDRKSYSVRKLRNAEQDETEGWQQPQ